MDSLAHTKDRAAQWLARRDSEEWSSSDEAQLSAWLNESTTNRVAFLRLEAAWQNAERLKVLGAGSPTGAIPDLTEWRASPFFKHQARSSTRDPLLPNATATAKPHVPLTRALAWGVAASILLAIGLVAWDRGVFRSNAYVTPVGGLAAVPLSDGSKVTLNTDSRIRVAVTDQERRIELEQGEAFFEVAADARRPFVVDAGNKRVVAVGTRFSVRREADDIRVAVTEGRVRVEPTGDGRAMNPTELPAGSVARTRDANVAVRKQPLLEVEELLSWRAGYVVFHETSLADAVAEFNRYNSRKIVIDDPAVSDIRVSGNLRATNVDAFAQLLEDGFPVAVARERDRIVLSVPRAH